MINLIIWMVGAFVWLALYLTSDPANSIFALASMICFGVAGILADLAIIKDKLPK